MSWRDWEKQAGRYDLYTFLIVLAMVLTASTTVYLIWKEVMP